MNKEQRSTIIEERFAFQKEHGDRAMPCPRCGKAMATPPIRNALSRRADIYVCDACGTEEAVRDWQSCPLPVEEWALFKNMAVPMERKNLTVGDLIEDDDDTVSVSLETWLDVEKKFGIDISRDDAWINLYASYAPERRELKMFFDLSYDDLSESFTYFPTDGERDLVIQLIEDYCQKENGCSVAKLLQDMKNN